MKIPRRAITIRWASWRANCTTHVSQRKDGALYRLRRCFLSIFRSSLLGLSALLSFSAIGAPLEYRFAGKLTGSSYAMFVVKSFIDTPFQISILADTNNSFATGYIAGAGPGFAVNGATAKWTLDGFGVATSNHVQIFALPGLGQVGFGWDGEVFPLNSELPAQTVFRFIGTQIATDTNYGRLSGPVDPIPVSLLTSLKNPPSMVPEYTTNIYFDGLAPLTLKGLTDINYSVIAVPEPSSYALMIVGCCVLAVVRRKRQALHGDQRSAQQMVTGDARNSGALLC